MKRYTDQVQINVRVIMDGTPDESVEEWFVTAQNLGEVDREAITADVLADLSPANYTLDVHHRSFNWGASAELFDLVIGIGGGAGGTLLASQLQRMAGRFRREDAPPMTDARATRETRNILCRRYNFNHDDFTLESVTIDIENHRATVVMVSPDGALNTVEMKQVGDRVALAKVTRTGS